MGNLKLPQLYNTITSIKSKIIIYSNVWIQL